MKAGIVGAGLLGRLLAWRLAREGHAVTVYDEARSLAHAPSSSAGFAAVGLLSPLAGLQHGTPEIFDLGLRSMTLWPAWLDALERPVHFRRDGSLLLAHPHDYGVVARLLARIDVHAPSHRPQALAGPALRALEPGLAPELMAWRLAGEGSIHPVQTLDALHAAASALGVQWHWSTTVSTVNAGRLEGETFDLVFDVRGVGARPDLPVRGVRGEIVWLHAPGIGLKHPLRLLHPRHRVCVVPRPDDIIAVGATEIESEDRSSWSVRSALELLSAAHSVLPALVDARIVHAQSSLRPALPDNLPWLRIEPGLVRINGLFRHGWLVAPAMVERALQGLHARESSAP